MKPDKLYRGVVLTSQQIHEMDWDKMDLIVPYEPIIDSQGRKTVRDGNEYGVYMTDNLTMVESAYGSAHGCCTPFQGASQLIIAGMRTAVGMPHVGVRYEIDISGLDVREPFITDQLKGHYNNGFEGKEWITDIVPKEAARVVSVEIGGDMLHDKQEIQINGQDTKGQVLQILAERESRLKELFVALEILPQEKKMRMTNADMKLYKAAFGENGLTRMDLDKFQIKDAKDMFTYIQAQICQQEKPSIDMGNIAEIRTLSNKLVEHAPVEAATKLLKDSLDKAKDKREEFENSDRPTNGINRTIARLSNWLNIAKQASLQEMEIDLTKLGAQEPIIDLEKSGTQQETDIIIDLSQCIPELENEFVPDVCEIEDLSEHTGPIIE